MTRSRRIHNKFFVGVFFVVLVIPAAVSAAGISISEIMYDLEGADSKHEWVEIHNTDAVDADIAGWKLFENDTNHGLTLHSGEEVIPAGGFVVIADDADTFLADWPSFSGTVFDSVFSLSNTGETITIRDAELNDVDSVTYNSEQGGAGDGNSLQKSGGAWIAAIPTPGTAHAGGTPPSEETEEIPPSSVSSSGSSPKFENDTRTIAASAGTDKRVIVGAETEFKGKAYGFDGAIMEAERYVWNFGDGTTVDGPNVLHAYRYPGKYLVFLDVVSGKYSASDTLIVTAVPAEVYISRVEDGSDGFIEIHNEAQFDIDLSWWMLEAGGGIFHIPENTIILAGTKVILSSKVTGLIASPDFRTALLYPNGEVSTVYGDRSRGDNLSNETQKKAPSVAAVLTSVESSQPLVVQKEKVEESESVPNEKPMSPDIAKPGGVGMIRWLSILFGIVLFSVIAVLLVRGEEAHAEEGEDDFSLEVKRVADGITIIEDD